MTDPVAFAAGVAQGSADAVNTQSSPTPPEYEGNADYAAGYEQGLANPSGPVSQPEPTDPSDVYQAGVEHGAEDSANQSSSPTSPELEDRKEYQEGDTFGSDPAAYAAGEQAGRADTVQKRSSATPPEYEGNAAYAQGYADGLAAPPYTSDVEAQAQAEQDARTPTLPPLDIAPRLPDDYTVYTPDNPRPPSMSAANPGDFPPAPADGEDGEMPHAEYGPEKAGQTWDPKTHSWKWDWEIQGQGGEGEADGETVGD